MYRLFVQVKHKSQESMLLPCGVLLMAIIVGFVVILLLVYIVSAIIRFFS